MNMCTVPKTGCRWILQLGTFSFGSGELIWIAGTGVPGTDKYVCMNIIRQFTIKMLESSSVIIYHRHNYCLHHLFIFFSFFSKVLLILLKTGSISCLLIYQKRHVSTCLDTSSDQSLIPLAEDEKLHVIHPRSTIIFMEKGCPLWFYPGSAACTVSSPVRKGGMLDVKACVQNTSGSGGTRGLE